MKVSALVSTYNSSNFLPGCMDDLTAQTLFQKGELEIIVIDSGSKENEEKIEKQVKTSTMGVALKILKFRWLLLTHYI